MSSQKFGAQPRANEPVVGRDGLVTQAWRDYFARLAMAQSSDDLRQLYEALAARVAELAEGQSIRIIGRNSVNSAGASVVEIQLVGDELTPGNTEYYGTGPTGQKGFFPVADAIAVDTGELEKSVGTDGVIILGLADVPNSGTGTLQAMTVDGKGRVTGTKAATITGTAQQINVANGNAAAGLPTLSLATEVLSALSEAVSALQPGDVAGPNSVKVTPNGSGGIVLNLDNDVASPAALTVYSTNSAGARGWHRPALFESTGVINGGALSINAGNSARFDMAQAVIGYTDWSVTPTQPTRVLATVGPFSAQVVTNIATANATYIGIQMPGGTIVQQTSPFTNAQRRTIAQIGALVHSNNTSINAINDQAATIRAGVNQIGDLMSAIGALNLRGNVYEANGANLSINKTAGAIYKMGANFQNSHLDPHVVSLGAQTALTFRYRLSNGAEGADVTSINPNQYESAPGVLTSIPILGNQWHVQRISVFQSGLTRIQYGQQLYASAQAAINGIFIDSFNTEQNIGENGILRCYLIINRGLLGLLGSATFVSVSKFGATQAGGGVVPVHNDLSGLQGGTSGEYYHLTSAQYTGLTPWAAVAPASKANDSAVVHLAGSETVTGAKTFTADQTLSGVMTALRTAANSGSYLTLQDGVVGVTLSSNGGMRFIVSASIEAFRFQAGAAVFSFAGVPVADNGVSWGTASARWSTIYAATGTINTSDAREKTPVRPFTPAELAAAAELGREIGIYQWLAMIAEKGDAARQHIGMTVQRAIEILRSHGLDPFAYGFICYDQWDELPEIRGEDGEIVQEHRPAGDRYSFRMDELLAFIARGLAHRLDTMEQRLAAAGL